MLAGIKDILIITTPEDSESFKRLLGSGERFGINLLYMVQEKPDGLASAFILGEHFIESDNVCLILGDNIFYGQNFTSKLKNAVQRVDEKGLSTIFGYQVKDPSRFGVVEFNDNKRAISIEEKPDAPKSNYAVTGLYFYPSSVVNYAKKVKPSHRGELEITDINIQYLNEDLLHVENLGRGFAWLDTGTHEALMQASNFVSVVEERQGFKIACLEEISFNNHWISKDTLLICASRYGKTRYAEYLKDIAGL